MAIVLLFSWPFQIAFLFLGDAYKPLLLVSMVMAGVATFVAGRFVFRDGFRHAGWKPGRLLYYLLAVLLALFLWYFPSVVERAAGWHPAAGEVGVPVWLPALMKGMALTLLPALGEEFSWRGYLLPNLLRKYSYKKALLVHGLVTWIWHLPFMGYMGMEMGGTPWVSIPLVAAISLVPTVMHAVVFAYLWSRSGSLVVVTVYHLLFDEVRDVLEATTGLGFFGQNWQMVVLLFLGAIFLWKGKWHFPWQGGGV